MLWVGVMAHAAGGPAMSRKFDMLDIWRMSVIGGAISSSNCATGRSEPSLPSTTASNVSLCLVGSGRALRKPTESSCSYGTFLAGSTSVSESPSCRMAVRSVCSAKKEDADENSASAHRNQLQVGARTPRALMIFPFGTRARFPTHGTRTLKKLKNLRKKWQP